jgi:replicative DNA helicase|tara:strand:+ start:1473 stop:1946 length:474 start_codon:yes stop_codon:yes gene_type:complete
MAEIEYKGVKVGGSKLLLIIPLIGTLIGGLWGGFEVYQRYLLMEKKINSFVSPDLSDYDKRIELAQQEVTMLKQEMQMILEEVKLVSDVAKELKDDLRLDLRNMQKDNRHIESIVNSVEDSTKENHRELLDNIKQLEDDLELKIQKALNNPLNALTK